MRLLFILFVIMPIVEMTVLIEVGSQIGAWKTILLVLLTAVIGATMLRRQGLNTLLKANQRMSAGEIPAKEVAEGFLLAVGGALLLTPGFVTDAMGFALLVPGVRGLMVGSLMKKMIMTGSQQFTQSSPFGDDVFRQTRSAQWEGRDSNGDIIEGEFHEETQQRSNPSDKIEKK